MEVCHEHPASRPPVGPRASADRPWPAEARAGRFSPPLLHAICHQATASGFKQLGIRPGLPALLAGTAEILGGFSLAAGLLTPVGTILIGAVMTTAILTAHARNGIWNAEGGFVLQQVDIARLATYELRDRAAARLRIGYTPASLPTSVPRALQRVAASIKGLEATLDPGFGLELIAAVRDERLDAAIVSVPAPTAGLRTTELARERAVAAFPVRHRHAIRPAIRLDQMAPERIVVLPREGSRPFYAAVLAACQSAALSPSLVETRGTCVEPALLAVASGAGIGLLPASVADRYSTPGVRFVPIDGEQPAVATAVVTRRDTAHLPTMAFLRAVVQAHTPATVVAPGTPVTTAA